MDCLVCLAICNGVLNGGNGFHTVSGFLHILTNGSGFITHALQGGVQIFQREKLMLLQIDGCLGDGFQIIGRAFLLSVSRNSFFASAFR